MAYYDDFSSAVRLCVDYARDYLHRCIIDGKVSGDDLYYFKNLFALKIDEATGEVKILCSNTNPDCENEALKSYNIRFLSIDKDIFNKTEEEFDKEHLNSSVYNLVMRLSHDEKLQLYDALKDSINDNIEG